MIWTFAYFMVAAGCNDAGMSFWRAMFWPVTAGKLLARAVGVELKERDVDPPYRGGIKQPRAAAPTTPPPPKPKG
jgi:fructose-1,6-bisphosphatase/inositol monophosphatase family enzyme